MENDRMITIREVCSHYNVEVSFLQSLHEFGLVRILTINEDEFIYEDSLSDMEMMIHLHYDLDINLEGLDAISHMLKRIKEMQKEMNALKNKLNQG